ncbi:uncharacterized protein LOC123681701 [Harmonia axyridis]|uniref:uncharacterized protein LOC123681701 n=1 Tax=Harmonia axyridis TaxID=115357 RepID=UPI001E279762|nr:uncharacterized protein LOC123681701 [Harmonia axyridis]
MSGLYLHSPQQQCGKDCHAYSPCSNKAEEIYIRGRPIMACVHTTQPTEVFTKPPNHIPKAIEDVPRKQSHTEGCLRNKGFVCPFGRCEDKSKDLFNHFYKNHDFVRVNLNVPLVYRLKNITKDMFIIYEQQKDVFFLGYIEDSYKNYIHFEMQVIYNYTKNCCGHPKFVLSIPGCVSNATIDTFKSKFSLGNGVRKIQIYKNNLRKSTGSKMFYDMEIMVKQIL